MNEMTPTIKSLTNKSFVENGVVLEKFSKQYEIQGNPDKLRTILNGMDGSRNISELSKLSGISEGNVEALAMQLKQENLVSDASAPDKVMSGEEFWEVHNDYCQDWLDKIAAHEIWPILTEGKADIAVVLGFVIEKYHYIEGAHEHMAYAAANADPRIATDLTRHFIEEYTHGDIYLRGLASMFPEETIVRSIPLPSTRALVNYLNELALTDSYSYYAANEFLQKTENIDEGPESPVEKFYKALEKHYDLPRAICTSMRAHTKLDQELGHDNVFKEMCEKLGDVPMDNVNQYLQATQRIAEHLEYFLDGILSWYTRFPYVPRPPAIPHAN